MFLKTKNTIIIFISFLFSTDFESDLFYNYYILNSSPSTIQYSDLLKANYESNLMHELEVDGIARQSYQDYELFLNQYYKQYKEENLKFINAIIEPDIFYISASIGSSNIIVGQNNYTFGREMGFHIDSPYAFKLLKRIIVLGLKSSFLSLPPTNSLNWDNFRKISMSSTYTMKFGKRIYTLSGLGISLNSSNSGTNILPLLSFDLAYELPWKPLSIPFDITLSSSIAWDLKNAYVGFNIMLCKPYRLVLDI